MKQKILLLLLLFSSILYTKVKANETEPNNSWNKANTLALNGTNNGVINPAGDIDWWKVTTNGDGALTLTLTARGGKPTYFDLYDTLGTIQVHGGTYTSGTTSYTANGLAQGTYYIKIYCYYQTDTSSYYISDALTVPAQANDAEPNNSRAQAKVLSLNSSKTGHIDYYYNNHRDSTDWYKVTTNADGRLRLTMASANGQNVWAYLYDNNGTTLLGSGYTSGTAVVVNADGLAAGTYYVRVNTYYNTEYAPYTLSDSLFTPTISNDTEPDSTRAQALTLPLNGNVKGHIDYYYNNHRDSVDWYKVTTNADGRLRLTMTSANGQNVWAYLYDNDAKTLITGSYTSGSAVVVDKDGLAAGTYYIRVNTFYTNEFAPYTLSDSLFVPTQANDAEPDSTKATALTLPLNGSVTGHVNYYYNNHKDTVDEYKLTTTADGNINLSLSIPNGTNVWFNLYDNDGNTLILQDYTSGNLNYNVDGLSKGTYYIKVFTYYGDQFAPYTLKDTLSTYNANDLEPNKYAKQAKTLNSNLANNGHVDFYYNNVRDTVDWFKINYTDNISGNMSVTLNLLNHITGSTQATWMQIYKDTATAPLYNSYTYGTETATLTGLTEGYYYVKVFEYYGGNFEAYTITPTFTQVDIAKLKVISKDTLANCADTSTLVVKPSGSHAPYTLQLYRFNTVYGDPVTVASSKNVTFSGLPEGSYSVRAYGDGATGTAFGKTPNIIFEPIPTGLKTTVIKTTSATLNWDTIPCVKYFVVQYKVHDSSTWLIKRPAGNVKSYILKGLTAGTTYDWKVAAADSANKLVAQSKYADSVTFTTKASALVADANDAEDDLSKNTDKNIGVISVAPNPASSYFTIHFNSLTADRLNATLFDATGKAVWTSGSINADALNGKQVIVSQFGNGLYYLRITDSKGTLVGNAKIAVTK